MARVRASGRAFLLVCPLLRWHGPLWLCERFASRLRGFAASWLAGSPAPTPASQRSFPPGCATAVPSSASRDFPPHEWTRSATSRWGDALRLRLVKNHVLHTTTLLCEASRMLSLGILHGWVEEEPQQVCVNPSSEWPFRLAWLQNKSFAST